MKIALTGDVFLGGDLCKFNAIESIQVKSYLEADTRIVNLEQAISDNNYLEDKGTLYTKSESLLKLRSMRVDVAGIANNHIHDKGLVGIQETKEHLTAAGVRCFGAGKTLVESSESIWLSEDLVIIGYCEFEKPYLKSVAVASDSISGVNPLRYDKIKQDLEALPANAKAILYFHWGEEHVWFPPSADIELAKKLLRHCKVALIVGMHSHRPQGYIKYNGKFAYMSLGNFLFPNFFYDQPAQLAHPDLDRINQGYDITRQYHGVLGLTYKKWRLINRVSLVVNLDWGTNRCGHQFAIQDDNSPVVSDIDKLSAIVWSFWIRILSIVYLLPSSIYKPVEVVLNKPSRMLWRFGFYMYLLRQWGLKYFTTRVFNKLRRFFLGGL
ncbi:CapA family protein [Pseudidiomarina aestuarii]|uniref:CapA family protein n=1 Tax=Pseudidiomarina aestuarii TaxID=624146 RepID=UPI003A977B60